MGKGRTSEESEHCFPALTHIGRSRKKQDFECGVQGINACKISASEICDCEICGTMIKQFPEGSTLLRPSSTNRSAGSKPAQLSSWRKAFPDLRLRTIHRIEGLVQEQADRPARIYPRWAVAVQRRIVPEHGEEVDDNEARKLDMRPIKRR